MSYSLVMFRILNACLPDAWVIHQPWLWDTAFYTVRHARDTNFWQLDSLNVQGLQQQRQFSFPARVYNLHIVWSMQVYMQRQSGNFLVFRTTLTQESKTDKMCACISIYISCSHHAYRFMTTSVTSITQNNFQFQEWILTSSSPFLFISSGQHYSWT